MTRFELNAKEHAFKLHFTAQINDGLLSMDLEKEFDDVVNDIVAFETQSLQAQLDAANELIEELGEALEDLLDHQNGCPLPKYEIPWNRAVESSRTALNKWRALKGHDEREVTG